MSKSVCLFSRQRPISNYHVISKIDCYKYLQFSIQFKHKLKSTQEKFWCDSVRPFSKIERLKKKGGRGSLQQFIYVVNEFKRL